ncbi:hypothetical protein KOW79_022636 [Hemibagrus wyckioides]|uniref:Uncharacterized protein n=1 Tax=Hemibagrus wyckioides TaxID=337641 RepID=A0A9D3N298_9TELE|nr:hypothetical protein KOW79_022636 [Hemibagrus wyckioides]
MSSFSLLSLWGMKQERLVALMLIRTRFCPLYSPPRRREGARTNLHFLPPGFERTAQTSPIKPVTLMMAERFPGPVDWKLDYMKREAEPVSIRVEKSITEETYKSAYKSKWSSSLHKPFC